MTTLDLDNYDDVALARKAAAEACDAQYASQGFIARQLNITEAKADQVLDALEEAGLIGAGQFHTSYEVLIQPMYVGDFIDANFPWPARDGVTP